MFESGRRAPEIVQELGLAQVSDADALAPSVAAVVARYPAEVAKYRAGSEKVLGLADGPGDARDRAARAIPAVVRELLEQALDHCCGRLVVTDRDTTKGVTPMDSVRLLNRIVQSLAALGLPVSRPQLTNLALLCQALAFSSSCHLATLALAVPTGWAARESGPTPAALPQEC